MKRITCRKCGQTKPETEFNWKNREAGERQSVCRACFSAYNRERYQRTKEATKARVSEYKKSNPDKVFETRLKTYQRKPSKSSLYKLVHAALSAGVVARPSKCQICGSDKDRIEAHHEDYSRPLEIIWCCPICHDKLDQDRRRREGGPYHSRIRSVMCVETGEEYPSIASAARAVGRKPNSISQCLGGRSETCAGCHWRYADDV